MACHLEENRPFRPVQGPESQAGDQGEPVIVLGQPMGQFHTVRFQDDPGPDPGLPEKLVRLVPEPPSRFQQDEGWFWSRRTFSRQLPVPGFQRGCFCQKNGGASR